MSLIRIGQRGPGGETPGTLLLDCHARIRHFAELAVRLAEVDAPEAEIRDAAARVHRYFTVALPLHVADEELSIAPRLRRFVPDALDAMEREHRAHTELLQRLIPAWVEPRRPDDLLDDSRLLASELNKHLEAEERLIIPALTHLGAESHAVVAEMRDRRR
jgi:iron-sulfur cluster repair protein YtfE (RIC family)